jgi:hypothetical protein
MQVLTSIALATTFTWINMWTGAHVVNEQTVTTGDVIAGVRVVEAPHAQYFIETNWAATSLKSAYPVGCLTAYNALRYVLRDSRGSVIPGTAKHLKGPPVSGNVHKTSRQLGCKEISPGQSELYLPLLYPNLSPGDYTLELTVSPPHLSAKRLQPIELRIATP